MGEEGAGNDLGSLGELFTHPGLCFFPSRGDTPGWVGDLRHLPSRRSVSQARSHVEGRRVSPQQRGHQEPQRWARALTDDGGRGRRGRQARLGLASRERGRRPKKRGRPRQKDERGTGMSAKKARSLAGDRAPPSDSSRSRATARISWRAAVFRSPLMSRRAATCFRLAREEHRDLTGVSWEPDRYPVHRCTLLNSVSFPVPSLVPISCSHFQIFHVESSRTLTSKLSSKVFLSNVSNPINLAFSLQSSL